MELIKKWRPSLVMAALSLSLVACGSSDDEAPVNVAPTITSQPILTGTEDIAYSYKVTVNDPDDANDGINLQFSLTNAPAGMVVSNKGDITWIPLEGVLKSGLVTLTVKDGGENGAKPATQQFEVIVKPVNDAPTVELVPVQSVDNGSNFTYQLKVTDVDDPNIETDIKFELVTGPSTLTISPKGLISYLSNATKTQLTPISIRVKDGGEDNAAPALANFNLNEKYFVPVSGTVSNYFNGQKIASSQVKVSNGTALISTLTTNTEGVFSTKIQDTAIPQRLTFSADAVGFSEAALSVSAGEVAAQHRLLLVPVHASVTFDASQSTELKVKNQLLVKLEPNSLVKANGSVATTAVVAELTVINPAIDIGLMPGDMVTRAANGELANIESFGAITVSFTDNTGSPLQIAQGKTAEINIPAVGSPLANTIPLYYFDPIKGLWIEEGIATLVTENGVKVYKGQVSHFTTWNADRIYDTIYVNGCVEDKDGNKLSNARIISDGRDYLGRSNGYSDVDGNFRLPVKKQSTVLVSATIGLQSRTQIVNVSGVDYTLPRCLVLSEALTKITLNWGLNPEDLDSHLFIEDKQNNKSHVYFGNKVVLLGNAQIYLDVDDIFSYGPEVISIPEFPVEGKYKYYVHQYSRTPEIEPASTRVEIIYNNQQFLFTPPLSGLTRWWHVADFDKLADGSIIMTDVNRWSTAPTYDDTEPSSPPRAQSIVPLKQFDSVVKGLISSKYYAE